MKIKQHPKTEIITFDEFIDCITGNRGEEIKREMRAIDQEKMGKEENHGRKPIKV